MLPSGSTATSPPRSSRATSRSASGFRTTPSRVITRLYAVDGACEHLEVVTGRCPTASGEVMVSTADVETNGWTVGSQVDFTERLEKALVPRAGRGHADRGRRLRPPPEDDDWLGAPAHRPGRHGDPRRRLRHRRLGHRAGHLHVSTAHRVAPDLQLRRVADGPGRGRPRRPAADRAGRRRAATGRRWRPRARSGSSPPPTCPTWRAGRGRAASRAARPSWSWSPSCWSWWRWCCGWCSSAATDDRRAELALARLRGRGRRARRRTSSRSCSRSPSPALRPACWSRRS